MEKLPKKIHIIGPSGTGKTTLATKLAQITGSELIELDKNDKPITELAEKDSWVTEGIYTTIEPLLINADQIIWMDYPLHINVIRVTTRFIKQRLNGTDKWGFISFLKLIQGTIGYSARRAETTSGDPGDITPAILENFLKPYEHKVIRIKNSRNYKDYLESFNKSHIYS